MLHFFILARVYSKVVEDYYPYNKIPRVLFKHKKRLASFSEYCILELNYVSFFFSKLMAEIRVNVGSVSCNSLGIKQLM